MALAEHWSEQVLALDPNSSGGSRNDTELQLLSAGRDLDRIQLGTALAANFLALVMALEVNSSDSSRNNLELQPLCDLAQMAAAMAMAAISSELEMVLASKRNDSEFQPRYDGSDRGVMLLVMALAA
jgi:hypothetical protein